MGREMGGGVGMVNVNTSNDGHHIHSQMLIVEHSRHLG